MKFTYRHLYTCFFLLFLTNTSIFCQSESSEDLLVELTRASGKEKVPLIIQLTAELGSLPIAAADSLIREGLEFAKAAEDSLAIARLGVNLGKVFYSKKEFDKGIELTQKSLKYFQNKEDYAFDVAKAQLALASHYIEKENFEKADDFLIASNRYFEKSSHSLWKCKVPHIRGMFYLRQREYDEALKYFSEALEKSQRLGDTEYIGRLLGNVALIHGIQGRYPEALEMEFQVITMNCSDLAKSNSHARIGQTYINLGDWALATKHLHQSIELQRKQGLECSTTNGLYALGVVEKRQENYGDALQYFQKCLTIKKKCNLNIGGVLGSIGDIHNYLGEPEKANKYYDKKMDLAIAQNNWEEIYLVHYNRGFFAFKAKRYEEALGFAMKSFDLATEHQRLRLLMKCNELLADIYTGLGDEGKSFFHQEQHLIYKDSILGIKKIKQIGVLEQEHSSKNQKDSLNQVNLAKKLANRNRRLSIISIVLLIGCCLGLCFWLFKKNHAKETIIEENKTSEQSKIETYLEELLMLLKEHKTVAESAQKKSLDADITPINDMATFLKNKLVTDDDWSSFEHYFEKVHPDFFKNLKKKYSTITINELNMCALLKLNLRNKDIAQIMGIGHDSVRIAQNRLSKKLQLSTGEVLRDFVLKL